MTSWTWQCKAVIRNFDILLDFSPKKLLNKQWWLTCWGLWVSSHLSQQNIWGWYSLKIHLNGGNGMFESRRTDAVCVLRPVFWYVSFKRRIVLKKVNLFASYIVAWFLFDASCWNPIWRGIENLRISRSQYCAVFVMNVLAKWQFVCSWCYPTGLCLNIKTVFSGMGFPL